MSAQLRPVARVEKESKSILRVEEIDVGVRLLYPYLLTPLQLYIYDKPYSQFAANLRLAGRLSRHQKFGSGFVRLYYNRIVVPMKDWEAVDRGESPLSKEEIITLNPETTRQLVEICGQAHQREIRELIHKLSASLRAAWFSDSSIVEIRELAFHELDKDPDVDFHGQMQFLEWVETMLKSTTLRDNHSLSL